MNQQVKNAKTEDQAYLQITLESYAKADLRAAQKHGTNIIIDTQIGNIDVQYDRVEGFCINGENMSFTAATKFIAANYEIEFED